MFGSYADVRVPGADPMMFVMWKWNEQRHNPQYQQNDSR